MKTNRYLWPLCAVACLVLSIDVQGQSSVPGNSGLSGDYSGWDGGTTIPLEVRHNGNYPIQWFTDSIQRMELWNSRSSTINSFPVKQNGFVGISDQPLFFDGATCPGPFSRLHLADSLSNNPFNFAQPLGFRPWMRNGVTFTGNADQGYVGQRFYGNDSTDMVIQWSDNPGTGNYTPDRLRFIFTGNYTAIDSGAKSMDGVEAMRMFPVDNFNVNVGIGDFVKRSVFLGTPVEPTERLHVLDGRVRIEQLPKEAEMDSVNKYVVVNEDGVLGWMPTPTGTGGGSGADCDWVIHPGTQNLYTAVVPVNAGPCPDLDNRVGIGVYDPNAKLHVVQTPQSAYAYSETGINVECITNQIAGDAAGTGVQATIYAGLGLTPADDHAAFRGFAYNGARYTYGVYGNAITEAGSTTTDYNIGVYGQASGNAPSNYGVKGYSLAGVDNVNYGVYGVVQLDSGIVNYGVYGTLVGSGSGTQYAGYFAGNVHITGALTAGTLTLTSDASIKTNVQDIDNAMDLISLLRPTTYDFLVDEHLSSNLPTGLQRGFIAQEVEQIMPDVVSDIVVTAIRDSTGAVVHPGETLKGINYVALIPMLVAGMQEQNTQLVEAIANNEALSDQLQTAMDRLEQMEHSLDACCVLYDVGGRSMGTGDALNEIDQKENDRNMRISPNPFTTNTTIYYQLEESGRMQLLANSADGKDLRVLHEANMEAGNYQYEWNTEALSPGVYYVTLLLDGKPITKRAVKIM